jgi:L-cysteine S-thiosulfotransferase
LVKEQGRQVVAGSFKPAVIALVLLGGCGGDFALPEGDIQRGRETFVELQCHSCHSVADIDQAESELSPPIHKRLGGEVTRVKRYEDLVTSIINPSHRPGRSAMPSYNDVMTVQQLVDLVTFLRSEYRVHVPPVHYPVYY